MKLPTRKSRLQRLVEFVNPLDRPNKIKLGLPNLGSSNLFPARLSQDKAMKGGCPVHRGTSVTTIPV